MVMTERDVRHPLSVPHAERRSSKHQDPRWLTQGQFSLLFDEIIGERERAKNGEQARPFREIRRAILERLTSDETGISEEQREVFTHTVKASDSLEEVFFRYYRPLLQRVASKMLSRKNLAVVETEDGEQIGMFGLRSVLQNYDGGSEEGFRNILGSAVERDIIDELRSKGSYSRQEAGHYRIAASVTEKLQDELQREPTTSEVTARLQDSGLSERDAKRAGDLRVAGSRKLSLDYQYTEGGASFHDILPSSEDNNPERVVLREMTVPHIREAVDALPQRLRRIVEGYYFTGQSYRQLADELGVGESRISQLLKEASERLREDPQVAAVWYGDNQDDKFARDKRIRQLSHMRPHQIQQIVGHEFGEEVSFPMLKDALRRRDKPTLSVTTPSEVMGVSPQPQQRRVQRPPEVFKAKSSTAQNIVSSRNRTEQQLPKADASQQTEVTQAHAEAQSITEAHNVMPISELGSRPSENSHTSKTDEGQDEIVQYQTPYGELFYDTVTRKVRSPFYRSNTPPGILSDTESFILHILASVPGKTFLMDELFARYKPKGDGGAHVHNRLRNAIYGLRSKLRDPYGKIIRLSEGKRGYYLATVEEEKPQQKASSGVSEPKGIFPSTENQGNTIQEPQISSSYVAPSAEVVRTPVENSPTQVKEKRRGGRRDILPDEVRTQRDTRILELVKEGGKTYKEIAEVVSREVGIEVNSANVNNVAYKARRQRQSSTATNISTRYKLEQPSTAGNTPDQSQSTVSRKQDHPLPDSEQNDDTRENYQTPFGNIVYDASSETIQSPLKGRYARPVYVSNEELFILQTLMESPGKKWTAEELHKLYEQNGVQRMSNAVNTLREKLGDNEGALIGTGESGYYFVAKERTVMPRIPMQNDTAERSVPAAEEDVRVGEQKEIELDTREAMQILAFVDRGGLTHEEIAKLVSKKLRQPVSKEDVQAAIYLRRQGLQQSVSVGDTGAPMERRRGGKRNILPDEVRTQRDTRILELVKEGGKTYKEIAEVVSREVGIEVNSANVNNAIYKSKKH